MLNETLSEDKAMLSQKYRDGKKLFSKIHGGLSAEQTVNTLNQVSPELARYSIEWIFGEIYSRPQLDFKTRELTNIAALVTLGNALPQVENHVRAALKVGCTPEEIKETILQMIIIAGFPAAVNAMFIAKKVFDEISSNLESSDIIQMLFKADELCFKQGNYAKAFEHYNNILTIEPKDITALSRRANIFRLWKQYDEALENVNTALELNNKNPYVIFTQIRILAETQQYDQAKKILNSNSSQKYTEARILQQKAAAESELGFYKKALASCDQALLLEPEDPGTIYTKAVTLMRLNKYEEALLNFHHALHLRPGHLLTIDHIRNCRASLIND